MYQLKNLLGVQEADAADVYQMFYKDTILATPLMTKLRWFSFVAVATSVTVVMLVGLVE